MSETKKQTVPEKRKQSILSELWARPAKRQNSGANSNSQPEPPAQAAAVVEASAPAGAAAQPAEPLAHADSASSSSQSPSAPGTPANPAPKSAAEGQPQTQPESQTRHSGTFSTHPKHRWRTPWNDDFPWCVDTKQGMTCAWCIEHWKGDPPVVPATSSSAAHLFVTSACTTYRKSSLVSHQDQPFHKAAMAARAQSASATPQPAQRTAEEEMLFRAFEKAVVTNRAALSQIITALYWLTKEAVALVCCRRACDSHVDSQVKLRSLLELCKLMGAPNIDKFTADTSYTSSTITSELLNSLSAAVRQGEAASIVNSAVISLMCDESTDVSNTKLLIVYLRICEEVVEDKTLQGGERKVLGYRPGAC